MGADKTLPENDTMSSEESTTPPPEAEVPVPQQEETADQLPKPAATTPSVRMRQKTPITAGVRGLDTSSPVVLGDPAAAIQRTLMGALYEAPPELEDSNEEIRRLDSQLDHLNTYMDKVEERIQKHNDKMQAMLKEQREEREKRRQSFHERMQINKQEDDDFQQQLSDLLNRVDMARHSVIGNSSE